MIRRIFAIWPPAGVLATAGLIYAGFQGFFIYLEISFGVRIFSWPDTDFLRVIMIGFAVGYAVYRVAAFHPAFRTDYYEWLRGTPWTSRKPLPLGPIHVVWQDLLMLAVLLALTWPRAEWLSVVVLQGFIVAFLLTLGLTHLYTGQKAWGYAALFGLGFAVWLGRDMPSFLARLPLSIWSPSWVYALPWPRSPGKTRPVCNRRPKPSRTSASLRQRTSIRWVGRMIGSGRRGWMNATPAGTSSWSGVCCWDGGFLSCTINFASPALPATDMLPTICSSDLAFSSIGSPRIATGTCLRSTFEADWQQAA